MKYEYNFYITDSSFDYGDFWGGTYKETDYHGFTVDIDTDNNIDLSSIHGYGDLAGVEFEIKDLADFKQFLISNLDTVQEYDEDAEYSNIERFRELISIIDLQLKAQNEFKLIA